MKLTEDQIRKLVNGAYRAGWANALEAVGKLTPPADIPTTYGESIEDTLIQYGAYDVDSLE